MFTTNTQLEEHKVTKLIDRIYRGERINENQFAQIWDLVNKRGIKTRREEIWKTPIYSGNYITGTETETRYKEGKMYLGVFAHKNTDDEVLVLCDVRQNGGKFIQISHSKKYSPHLFWSGW